MVALFYWGAGIVISMGVVAEQADDMMQSDAMSDVSFHSKTHNLVGTLIRNGSIELTKHHTRVCVNSAAVCTRGL